MEKMKHWEERKCYKCQKQFIRWIIEVLNQEYNGNIALFKEKINSL